jgi:hypothetical protein
MISGAITGLWTFVGMMIGSIVVARRVRRTAARAEAGEEAVFFLVGANLPDQGRRYSLGRVPAGSEFRWSPRWLWTRLRELPADLSYVCRREPAFRERLWLASDAVVIECDSSAGPVRLWAHAEHAVHVVRMIRSGRGGPAPVTDAP